MGIFIALHPMEFILLRFARESSHVADFNTCNRLLTSLIKGYRYRKLCKTFSTMADTMILYLNFMSDLNLSCASDSELEFYCDLV